MKLTERSKFIKTHVVCQNEQIVPRQPRQSIILWQIICVIQPLNLTVLGINNILVGTLLGPTYRAH